MSEKTKTFEENLAALEAIVGRLESGDVPLEEAVAEFQKGMKLSQDLQSRLEKAEKTLVTIVNQDGTKEEQA